MGVTYCRPIFIFAQLAPQMNTTMSSSTRFLRFFKANYLQSDEPSSY
ncbi:MAG: hypothetical protein ABSA11_03320 [Candidatus Bathyarchaeia archaeon]